MSFILLTGIICQTHREICRVFVNLTNKLRRVIECIKRMKIYYKTLDCKHVFNQKYKASTLTQFRLMVRKLKYIIIELLMDLFTFVLNVIVLKKMPEVQIICISICFSLSTMMTSSYCINQLLEHPVFPKLFVML